MGHDYSWEDFPLKTSKENMQKWANQTHKIRCEYHDSCPPIQFMDNRVFDSYEEAMQWVKDYQRSRYYAQVAVKYKTDVEFKKSAKLTALEKRAENARHEYYKLDNANHFKNHKSKLIECKHCESKLAVSYIRERTSNRCPVCGHDLRPQSTLDRIKALQTKAKALEEESTALFRKEREKHLSKAEVRWLVRIEYHV